MKKPSRVVLEGFLVFVRLKGLEPPRREAPDPKSGVATNYTTAAFGLRCKGKYFLLICNIQKNFFRNVRLFVKKLHLPRYLVYNIRIAFILSGIIRIGVFTIIP